LQTYFYRRNDRHTQEQEYDVKHEIVLFQESRKQVVDIEIDYRDIKYQSDGLVQHLMRQGNITIVHNDQKEEKYDPKENMIEYSFLNSLFYELVKFLIIINI